MSHDEELRTLEAKLHAVEVENEVLREQLKKSDEERDRLRAFFLIEGGETFSSTNLLLDALFRNMKMHLSQITDLLIDKNKAPLINAALSVLLEKVLYFVYLKLLDCIGKIDFEGDPETLGTTIEHALSSIFASIGINPEFTIILAGLGRVCCDMFMESSLKAAMENPNDAFSPFLKMDRKKSGEVNSELLPLEKELCTVTSLMEIVLPQLSSVDAALNDTSSHTDVEQTVREYKDAVQKHQALQDRKNQLQKLQTHHI